MSFTRAGQLARSSLSARPSDPLALVAENLRSTPHGVLPVFDRITFGPDDPSEYTARVIGLISQKDLSRVTQRLFVPTRTHGYTSGGYGSSANGGSANGAAVNGGYNPNLNGNALGNGHSLGLNGNGPYSAESHHAKPRAESGSGEPLAGEEPQGAGSGGTTLGSTEQSGADLNGYAPHTLASENAPASPQSFSGETVSRETASRENLNGSRPISPAWNELTARDVMQSEVPFIPDTLSLSDALMALERTDYPALPVYDGMGRYWGLVSRADLISALSGGVRPPLVGGMATPLGVWLTDGRLSGGAPALGLFLTGLTLAVFFAISQLILALGAMLLNPAWGALTFSGRLGMMTPEGSLLNVVFFGIHSLLFLGMFRLFPLSGIHAAEHQVVHALERGLPLEPEIVAKMPRAHPRCGTNLTAIAGLITIGVVHLPDVSPDWVIMLLIGTFFAWRAVGTLLQTMLTTRPANRKQLESGIKAAKELIKKYQSQQRSMPPLPLRLLNGGMVPVALGWILGLSLWYYVFGAISLLVLRR